MSGGGSLQQVVSDVQTHIGEVQTHIGEVQTFISEVQTHIDNSLQLGNAPAADTSLSDLMSAFASNCSPQDQFHFPEAVHDLKAALQDLVGELPLIDPSIASWVHQLLDSHITRDEWFADNMAQTTEALQDLDHNWLVT